MDSESHNAGSDQLITEFETYEQFLDSQITPLDVFYLEDELLARQLIELGYRGTGEVIKREDFEARKQAAEASRKANRERMEMVSIGKKYKDPLLRLLANREEANRNGKMTTIVYIRDYNKKGQEISGYIDYAHRLKSEDMKPYFSGKKKFLPKCTDLSFYNWSTCSASCSSNLNYQVISENASGLLLKNKKDRKLINLDPKVLPGDNTTRVDLRSPNYKHVVIYDHITRRKT